MARSELPMIPVATAEILYVALGHVLAYVDKHGNYPQHMADNMRQVMKTYHKVRGNTMAHRGHTPDSIQRYTAMAQRSLERWLDTRTAKTEELQADFDRWANELNSDHGEEMSE